MTIPHTPSVESPVSGVQLRLVDVGTGVRLRVAEAGPKHGTLVILLHGFPESWYSWRHQLCTLADNGFLAVAPDLRGFGGSSAPPEVADYDINCYAADVLGILALHRREQAYLVGHDTGAYLTWHLARMYPNRFPGICAMSVPDLFIGRGELTPLQGMRKIFGDFEDAKQRFFYVLYHNERNGAHGPAEAEYDADPRLTLLKFLTDYKQVPMHPPAITSELRAAGGMLGRMPTPQRLPPWLPKADFDYIVTQYMRPQGQGFFGGMGNYRNFHRNHYLTQHLASTLVQQPTLFIAGQDDMLIYNAGGRHKVKEALRTNPGVKKMVFFKDCGHWVQQERAADTSEELVAFLRALPALSGISSRL
eukprot:gnl/TRDRNA2_/TRDRNA2_158852_c0_seq1.p1 gnl/TRDRNA2_/TRDRNA2_158852_c0~~gnl/TRDRNA2_/TRDRNA2_158852_c0_seq1.p1  ORF type:complete len:362 (+),score=47.95 gnl/TRDRNA2_/TRDRNA2_158852_c0_seq1:65-1150(+)